MALIAMDRELLNLISDTLSKSVPAEYDFLRKVDSAMSAHKPWQVALIAVLVFKVVSLVLQAVVGLRQVDLKKKFFGFVKSLPFVKGLVEKELSKNLKSLEDDLSAQIGSMKYLRRLPDKGWSKERVVKEIEQCMDLGEFKAEAGALSGTCHKPPEHEKVEVVTEAYRLTAYANPLNPDAFPGIRKMEAEVVRMAVNLFHGDEEACGTMTSGGTESLILACKTYRNMAREERSITNPNLVMSTSGHVGFDKAGHLLGIEVRKVPMDPKTMEPDLKKYAQAIDSNTIMVS